MARVNAGQVHQALQAHGYILSGSRGLRCYTAWSTYGHMEIDPAPRFDFSLPLRRQRALEMLEILRAAGFHSETDERLRIIVNGQGQTRS